MTYDFYSVATDNVGNQENKTPVIEASTTVDATWGTADLGVTLLGTEEILLGATSDITVHVVNEGPMQATDIELTLNWPASLEFQNSSIPLDFDPETRIWSITSLAVDAEITLVVTFNNVAVGNQNVSATVGTVLLDDLNASNNAAIFDLFIYELDCFGEVNGTAFIDECDTCVSSIDEACVQDCNDVWGGDAVADNCGTCDNDATNDCVQDCNNDWGGNAVEDNCGTCDNDVTNDCVQDCNDVWGGDATEDNCGTCDNDATNDCVQDCNNTCGGTAYLDTCSICVGGNTGLMPCAAEVPDAGEGNGNEFDSGAVPVPQLDAGSLPTDPSIDSGLPEASIGDAGMADGSTDGIAIDAGVTDGSVDGSELDAGITKAVPMDLPKVIARVT